MQAPTPEQQQQIFAQVQAEAQAQMMKELMRKMTQTCFNKCAGKTGNGLDSREQQCLSHCVDRYFETLTVVATSLSQNDS
mmetsp:Transcript_896/g.895  ORF Transcript_896/g.895 Transcript_896/m.895 type:complete len:80 (-) Transcript_896:72-311(-)